MGWRIRKSINLGLGFRINLSKSGIGYSWGFPGYRTTKLANGGIRQTYSIPGTGISYVEQYGKSKNNRENPEHNLMMGEIEYYDNIPIKDLQKNDPILKEINKALTVNRIANASLVLCLLVFIHPAYILFFFPWMILKIIIATFMKTRLYYSFDDENRKLYDSLKEVLIILSQSRKIWQISSNTKIYNRKYNAGSGNSVQRNNAFVTNKLPDYIKTNIEVYGLNLKNQKMFFTPDRILIFRPFRKVYGCTYRDMYLKISSQRFIEAGRVHKDSEIVDYAWHYSNSDGSRDLRFKNNRRYPVCKYGELTIKSPNGINTIIEFSNHSLAEHIQTQIILFGNQFNSLLESKNKDEKSINQSKEEVPKVKLSDLMKKYDEDRDTPDEPLYNEIVEFVVTQGKASASLLQRRFHLGYNRAARCIDLLEERGIIGPNKGSAPREVLVRIEKDGE